MDPSANGRKILPTEMHLFLGPFLKLHVSICTCSLFSRSGHKYGFSCAHFVYEKLGGSRLGENHPISSKVHAYVLSRNYNQYANNNSKKLFHFKRDCMYGIENKVYVKGKLYEVIPTLCMNKDTKGIVSNIIFFILKLLNSKNVETTEEYRDNIKKIYSVLLSCYNEIFKNDICNAELLFAVFNDDIVQSVSPSLKRNKKKMIQELVLNSLHFFFKTNVNLKDKLDINLLCEIVKYKRFLSVLNGIHYEKEQLNEKLCVRNVDYLLYHFLNDKIYISSAIELVSLFVCDEDIVTMNSPIKKNSSITLVVILKHILKMESKNFLFLFLDSLNNHHLKKDVLLFLLSTNGKTALLHSYWGYLATKEYQMLKYKDEEEGKIEIKDVTEVSELSGDSLKKGNLPQSDMKDSPILKKCEYLSTDLRSEYYILPEEVKNIFVLRQLDDFKKMVGEIEDAQKNHWKNYIYKGGVMCSNVSKEHLTGEDIYNSLRREGKRFYVSIDVEWNRNKKVSVISLATRSKIYVADLLNTDYNYKLIIYFFFKWLLENPFVYKLFYNFACDMKIMSLFFQNISNVCRYVNVIDLKDPITVYSYDNKNMYGRDNIIYFEQLTKNIIENNDIHLFKKITNSTIHNFNCEMKNNFKRNMQNVISVSSSCMKKLYFSSLNDICEKILNKKLDKHLQLSNWNKRPLTKEQIEYASLDAYVLIQIEEMLIGKNYFSTCLSNSSNLIDVFVQKYKMKDCTWEW
ncbi:exonuclease, putative [Plasmodium ovale wallikeri]|uniref:Exonuclease, putative n=1 Tax=Plasmodium ovale wallikeri TaxID=864142 RepID=A0A1A8YZR0_PLAOA|nr:exonuclease, putative [Plasmodium ovale wallikeri]